MTERILMCKVRHNVDRSNGLKAGVGMLSRHAQIVRTKEAGTILLETLLVLPIYAVLLGGLMWFGELAYSRHALLVADRLAAWSLDNRLNPLSEDDVHKLLWKDYEHLDPNDDRGGIFDPFRGQTLSVKNGAEDPNPGSWWIRSFAYALCPKQSPPVWVAGWLRANVLMDTPADNAEDAKVYEYSILDLLGRTDADTPAAESKKLEERVVFGGGGESPTAGHMVYVRGRGAMCDARNNFKVTIDPSGGGADTKSYSQAQDVLYLATQRDDMDSL